MDNNRENIVVIEPSGIVFEGLASSISKKDHNLLFYRLNDIFELEVFRLARETSVVIVNPSLLQNRTNEFAKIKKQFPDIYWIGIVYCYFENSALRKLDDYFGVSDDIDTIVRKIRRVNKGNSGKDCSGEELTEREEDVLKLLAEGMSNKEIGDKLNISVHTVNSHRKNIMEKTGIRSVSGLTIYAVSKGIIALD